MSNPQTRPPYDPELAKVRLQAEIELRKLIAASTAKEDASKYLGKYGIASLTTSLLTEGAGTRSSLELADAVDDLVCPVRIAESTDGESRLNHPYILRPVEWSCLNGRGS